MITITIINLKGGVGKSVTSCNMAAELAAAGNSVLVVDLDKQANTTKFFGGLDYDRASVADLLTGDRFASAALIETELPGVGLLPANMRLLKANRQVLLDTTEPQQTRLRDQLAQIAADWDVALLDCPPDLDMGSINALCAADWVIVPVDCDEWATDGLREILDQMERIRMYYNPRLRLMGVLVTKYQRTRYARQAVEELAAMQLPVFRAVIRQCTAVKEAKHLHKPLRDYKPKCTAAQDYADLVREVLKNLEV